MRNLVLGSILSLTATAALAGCGSSAPDDFTLIQEPPNIAKVDLAPDGTTKGDQFHFEAKLTENEKPAGILFGQLTVIGIAGQANRARDEQIDRSDLAFKLPDGDIFAVGVAVYPRSKWKLRAQEPNDRAILGGTGKYAGVHGQLVTTRRADGTYQHQFRFSD